jgi:hypothetical protein
MKLSLMRAMYGDPDLLAEDIGYRGFNISVAGTKYDPDKTGVINTAEIAYRATKWALKKATSKAMTILLEKADPNVRRIIQRARKFAKSREQAASVILGGDGYYSLFESIYNSGDPAKKANLSRCLGIFKDPHGMTVDPDPPLSLIKQGCEELKIAAAIAVYREMEQTISYVYNPQLREAINESTLAEVQKEMGEYGGKIEFDLLEDDEIKPIVRARRKAEDYYQEQILAGKRPVFRYMGDITFRVSKRGGTPTAIDLCPSQTHPITEVRARTIRLASLVEATRSRPTPRAPRVPGGGRKAVVFERPPREMGAVPAAPAGSTTKEPGMETLPTPESIDDALHSFAEAYPNIVERVGIQPEMYAAVRAAANVMTAAKGGGFGRIEFFFPDDSGNPGKKSTNLDTQGSIGLPRIIAGVVRGYFTGARPDTVPASVLRIIAGHLAPMLTVSETGDVTPADGPALRLLLREQGYGSSRSVLTNDDSAKSFLLVLYHLAHLASGTVRAKRRDSMRGRLASVSPTAQFDIALSNFLNLAQMATLYPDTPGFEKSPTLDLTGTPPSLIKRLRAAAMTPGGYATRRRAFRTGGENVIPGMEPAAMPYVEPMSAEDEEEGSLISPPRPITPEEITHAQRSKDIVVAIRDIMRDAARTAGSLIAASRRLAEVPRQANMVGQGGYIPAMAYTQRVDVIMRNDRASGATYGITSIGYSVPGRLCFEDSTAEMGRRVWDVVKGKQGIKGDASSPYSFASHYSDWRDLFLDAKTRNATARTFLVITLDHYAYPVFRSVHEILEEYFKRDMISSEQKEILQRAATGMLTRLVTDATSKNIKVSTSTPVDVFSLTRTQLATIKLGSAMSPNVSGITPPDLGRNPISLVKILEDAPRVIDYRGLQTTLLGGDAGGDAPPAGSGTPPSEPPPGDTTPPPPTEPPPSSGPTASPVVYKVTRKGERATNLKFSELVKQQRMFSVEIGVPDGKIIVSALRPVDPSVCQNAFDSGVYAKISVDPEDAQVDIEKGAGSVPLGGLMSIADLGSDALSVGDLVAALLVAPNVKTQLGKTSASDVTLIF